MKLRIYKAIPTYSAYLKAFYNTHSLSGAPYSFDSLIEQLKADCFQWILSWKKYNIDPDIEIFETVPNDFLLQNAWAGGKYSYEGDWEKAIVREQIKSFHPNICILYSPETFDASFVNQIKECNPGLVIGGYDGMDRQNLRLYDGYDFVITCSEYISRYYSANKMATYPMKFGFDPDVLNRTSVRSKKYQTSFSGSIFPNIHNDRFELLSFLQKSTKVTVASDYASSPNKTLFSRHVLRQMKGLPIRRLADYLCLYHRNVGPLFGMEMFQFLRDSHVVLNMHGDKIHFAANIRLYEATGVGSCLLTDWKENLSNLFEPGKEILTYRTKEEALDKILYCKSNPSFATRIAAKGQERTLSNYSYRQIVPDIIRFLKQFVDY